MTEAVDGFAGPIDVRQFRGGQSNPTYLVDSPGGRYVLRRKPPGKLLPSAHAVDREYRIMRALHDTGYPVPRPRVLCEDESVVGTMFYIMDFVGGRIFWDLDLPGIEPDERAAIYDAMVSALARLHSIEPDSVGLEEFGRRGNYFARQIARWSKQYRASETERIAEMDALIEWLPENVPSSESTTIVHGDYRLDNMIFHAERPEVVAVLDWELSTLGDPLADLSYHVMAWSLPVLGASMSSLKNCDLAALGIPEEDDYIARYCELTGRDGLPGRDFYAAYNFFRLAAIFQGIAGRVRDGTASSAHAGDAQDNVIPLARLGWARAERAMT